MYKQVDDTITIQQTIDDVVRWTTDNDMRLNCDKIVDYGRNQSKSSHAQIIVNARCGSITSHNLTWNKHVDNIVSKAVETSQNEVESVHLNWFRYM